MFPPFLLALFVVFLVGNSKNPIVLLFLPLRPRHGMDVRPGWRPHALSTHPVRTPLISRHTSFTAPTNNPASPTIQQLILYPNKRRPHRRSLVERLGRLSALPSMYSTINATGDIPWHCQSRSLQSSASFSLNTKAITTVVYDRVIGLAIVSGVV